MSLLLDSFWRAVAYCLHPRVIALSLLPLGLLVALSFGLGYLYWASAVAAVAAWLDASVVFATLWGWLGQLGAGELRHGIAPVLLVLLVAPALIVLALLLVALLMTPAVLRLVATRRFATLERRGASSMLGSALWSLGHTVLALVALALSLPLWLVPPLILIVPPLIWGWLTYRVMSYDALDAHASRAERRAILRQHRAPLLAMGIVCGYLGAAPALAWASLALFAVAFAVLIPLAIWIYTLVFAFSALWFTHYCLSALQALRQSAPAAIETEAIAAPAALSHEP
ncbi:MAG: EI24 domain-containing protein [Proteobacteria bacterium]|nr:EI24 domain-containing protein [Burkholderiales bacterium]MCA0310471.1 EI24 domain-containing protein [Pseudomonadota bacterium]